jgi:hypothetical protein
MRAFLFALVAIALAGVAGAAADLSAVVQKRSVDVYAEPRLDAKRVGKLKQYAKVTVSAQQGLWYRVSAATGVAGFVRVNDVRVSQPGRAGDDANLRALTEGKGGAGRVTETAGVRGIDESDLRSASLDSAQLAALLANRVDAETAATYAAAQGWQTTTVAYAAEARPTKTSDVASGPSMSSKASAAKSAVGGLLGSFGLPAPSVPTAVDQALTVAPKPEEQIAAEERALGPEIAGRVLGARPLWADAAAQKRVNLVGRWVASQTSRPDLPWSFGVIDTPEVNAFAAPGGFVLVTRGLYELLSSDAEVAAVLGHEIGHCVRRDHYGVIQRQEMASLGKDRALANVNISAGGGPAAYARHYAEEHGATILLTSLDREAEYRADEAAEIYLARSGMNPLALYAVLQKMAALGEESAALAQLYATHPSLPARLDRLDQRGAGELKPYLKRE